MKKFNYIYHYITVNIMSILYYTENVISLYIYVYLNILYH